MTALQERGSGGFEGGGVDTPNAHYVSFFKLKIGKITEINTKAHTKKYDIDTKDSQNFLFYGSKRYGVTRVMANKQLFKDGLKNISL